MNIVLLIFIAAAAAIGFSIAGVLLGRHLLRPRVAAGHHEVLLAFLQTGGTLHAVFLAFLVVVVWQSYDAARANVADEASALATLYRASTGMGPSMGNALRKLIREYVDAVIHDEWTIQAETGGASSRARAASLGMYRLFGREDPAIKQQESAIDGAALQPQQVRALAGGVRLGGCDAVRDRLRWSLCRATCPRRANRGMAEPPADLI